MLRDLHFYPSCNMSIMKAKEKVILERTDCFWTKLDKHWCSQKPLRWKYLAMVHLFCHCDWQISMIALAFGHPKGHVSRVIRSTLDSLRETFTLSIKKEKELADEDSP